MEKQYIEAFFRSMSRMAKNGHSAFIKNISDEMKKQSPKSVYEKVKNNYNKEQEELSNLKKSLRKSLQAAERVAKKHGYSPPKKTRVPKIIRNTANMVPYKKDTTIERTINNYEIFS